MKVCFETFGCRLNRAEALDMEADYLARGWTITEKHSEAHEIVVRGCSVTARAQKDCERLIAHLKAKYPHTKIVVTGCIKDKTPVASPAQTSQAEVPVPTRTARAYLKVQDGCSGQCTFCIVPKFRGKSVSIPSQDLIDKAKRFIDAGYHEIVLTGCNLAQYNDGGRFLPELLATLPEGARYRLGSLEPGSVALSAIDVMAERPDFCRFLHIPVQSGSNIVLKAMRRPYMIHDVETLVNAAISKMPRLGLGCDMIAGFPGETPVDHIASLGLLKRLPFNNAHVFPYSSRPGTIAAALPGEIPRDIRHARAHELADVSENTRRKFAKTFINTNVEIVLEDEKKMSGWTGEYLSVEILNRHCVSGKRKDIVRVHITGAESDRLVGLAIQPTRETYLG